eukprot:SAG31_NODE_14673_length_793_cov_1.357349_1_plen_101_part_00
MPPAAARRLALHLWPTRSQCMSPHNRSPSPLPVPVRIRYQLPPSFYPPERRRAVLSRKLLERWLDDAESDIRRRAQRIAVLERRARRWRNIPPLPLRVSR